MFKLGFINRVRRKLTNYLMRRFGANQSLESFKHLNQIKVKNILISRPNQRLGNLILLTALIQELELTFPNAKINIVVKGNLAHTLFENYKSIDRIIELPKKPFKFLLKYIYKWYSVRDKIYDLAINPVKNSSSGKLLVAFSRADYKLYGEFNSEIALKDQSLHMAKISIQELRYVFNKQNNSKDLNSNIPDLKLKLSASEILKGKNLLKRLTSDVKPTMAIFTYATGNKCYSEDWWQEFYKALQFKFSKYTIIEILPYENVSRINFKAPHYFSKDLREIASVLFNTDVFIGADSGMMHLASAANAHTIGLFSVRKPEVYGPYGEGNSAIFTPNYTIPEIIENINDQIHFKKNQLENTLLYA